MVQSLKGEVVWTSHTHSSSHLCVIGCAWSVVTSAKMQTIVCKLLKHLLSMPYIIVLHPVADAFLVFYGLTWNFTFASLHSRTRLAIYRTLENLFMSFWSFACQIRTLLKGVWLPRRVWRHRGVSWPEFWGLFACVGSCERGVPPRTRGLPPAVRSAFWPWVLSGRR